MNEQATTKVAFVVLPAIPVVIGGVSTPVAQGFDIVTLAIFAAIFYLITAAVTAALGAPISIGCGAEIS